MTVHDDKFVKQLHADVKAWIEQGKSLGLLYKGKKLNQAKEWARLNAISREAWEFIEAGIAEENDWIMEHLPQLSYAARGALNNIIGYSGLLMNEFKEAADPSSLEDLRSINYSGYQLLRLVNSFVDFARIKTGQMELNLEELELEAVIDSSFARMRKNTAYRGDKLEKYIVDDLPKPHGDPLRARQIIDAAMYALTVFATGDTIAVRVRHVAPNVQIDIVKNGAGDYFGKHIETSISMKVAHELVKLQNGRMWFSTGTESSTGISFTLPVRPPDAE